MTNNSQDWGSRPTPANQPPAQVPPIPPAAAPHSPTHAAQPVQPAPAAPQPTRSQPSRRAVTPPARRRPGCGSAALVALIILALGVLAFGMVLVGYAAIARDLPMPDELQARASHFASTLIYDRAGNVLNEVGDPNYGRRTAVTLEQISPYLVDATIATEDPNFWQHPGVDPVGLLRAVYYAVKERSLSGPGGSTITQQLVKLTFLSSERTITRKVKEAILAAELTRRYPRETILQIYLNELNYGNLAYGIEAAAETYFDKSAQDLTLAQAAMLAGLPQAPAYYDPYSKLWEADGRPGAVKRRQGAVLRLMVEHGAITPAQADAAWAEPLALKPLKQVYLSQYPHFVQYARSQVEQTLGPQLAAKGGLRIYTTLDRHIQEIAQEEVARQTSALAKQGGNNAASVAIRPATGEVLALVGSADFNNAAISGQIDMALAPRQPGSAIKPFTYLAAFEMPAAVNTDPSAPGSSQISAIEPPGYWTPATAIMDVRTEFPDGVNPLYVPTNYDGKEHGLVNVRTALGNSYNIPAVKALEHIGLDRLKDVARRAGITTLTQPDYGLSLTLGGGEVTLLELTGAYATLANGGTRAPISPIACVLDADGKLIWQGAAAAAVSVCSAAGSPVSGAVTPAPAEPVFSPQLVHLITSILADPEARKPMFASAANVMTLPGRPAAVKTGTTNDYRDAWTVGYTPDLAVGAWVGNADYKPMQKVAGSLGAAPIWHNVMARALEGQPAQPFTPPPGIHRSPVCADSGTQPSEACPGTREELFAAERGPLPAVYDLWQRVRVDKLTGQLANEFTPADRIETRDVAIFPEKYREWAAAHGYSVLNALPPYPFQPELALDSPLDESEVAGRVPLAGRVHIPEPLVWRLEYGVGPAPLGWGVLSGPNPADPNDPASLGRELDGPLGEWDVAATAAQHGVTDFSLRLAAYDPANMAYPVAVSNVVYVVLAALPTDTPAPAESPTPPEVSVLTLTPEPALTATPTPEATLTPAPAETPTPTPTVEPPPTAEASPTSSPEAELRAIIAQPVEGAVITGSVAVIGSAGGAGFVGYVLDYAVGDQPSETDWQMVALPGSAPVSDGTLAVWQTDTLASGIYALRLRVLDSSGNVRASQVRVIVAR
jgi:membrane peptidoglycan carboxypeptidase